MSEPDLREQLAAAASADSPFPEDRFAGRGIVICAGGARLFTCAWVAIALLRRHLACTLPIEVWHLGPEEMGPPMRGLLEELDAQPVDAFEVAKRHQVERLGGWELKPYAVMHSRFREVLLLDADNVPVRDPSFLFDRPEFRDTGALFWPDIVRLSPDNEIWAISGLSYRDMWSVESGQMVLDKSRCWRALSLSHWINQHSHVFYQFLHGDKDTLVIAWLMLAQPYQFIRHSPKLLEATLCQRDPEGAVLFQHRNGAKWILDGNNPRIDGFRLEGECRALLRELARLWDGRVFNPPPRSDEARRLEADLARTASFASFGFLPTKERLNCWLTTASVPAVSTNTIGMRATVRTARSCASNGTACAAVRCDCPRTGPGAAGISNHPACPSSWFLPMPAISSSAVVTEATETLCC